MKANEIKKGMVFQVEGKNILVKHVQVQSPSSRSGSTLYKVRGQDLVSQQKYERRFKGDESVDSVDMVRRAVQMSYRDGDGCTFMDTESYEQYTLSDEALADELDFLTDGLEGISALIADGVVLAIELPATVALEITECAPGMRAASSSARTKPATLSTGLIIQVPEYLTPGEVIKVNSETREFISRA
ncbi:Elongation factor P-like protein [hydrothermal vent metagenome]|uniref:Elongation factor P-like protein n=1 Tax=hydrothermal vent metagenome TaxID=652676 RepID=A0A3B0YGL1_9ZZZZ